MDTNGDIFKTISDATFKDIATAMVRGMFEENIEHPQPELRQQPSLHTVDEKNSAKSWRTPMTSRRLRVALVRTAGSGGASGGTTTTGVPGGTGGTTGTEERLGLGGTTGTGAALAQRRQTSRPAKKAPPAEKKKPRNLDLGQVKAPDSYPEALKSLLGELYKVMFRSSRTEPS